jgi:pimeloyl-ACP methyl ester carboxylesterase
VPTAHLNGIDLYYERTGAGPRLLFFNGSGSTLKSSALLIQPLTQHFDTLAHDQRGLGQTEIPPGPYTMAEYAADAIALLDLVGWDTCRVMGVSFGGMVAQEFAVTVPGRVERLALCCTSPGGPNTSSYPLHTLAAKPPEEQAAIRRRITDTRFTDEWLATHPSDKAIVDFMESISAAPVSEDVARGRALQLEARSHHDVCDRLHLITAPTFVASGRYDGIAPPENGEAIAAAVPNARFAQYEGGHVFFIQDPTALPDLIGFLSTDS